MISKDPTDELKEKLLTTPVAGITKVLAVGKLKKNYHEFEKRRELVNRYDAFFCDDRVVTMMPKLCGKVFFERKKLPVPVRVSGSSIAVAKEMNKARDSTYMIIGAGQTISIRIGKNTMTPQQITDNVYAVLSTAIDAIPKKWKAVGSLYIQATGTVALPIYKKLPQLIVADEEDDDSDDDNGDDDDDKYRYLNEQLDNDDDDSDHDDDEPEEKNTKTITSKKSTTTSIKSDDKVEVGKKRGRTTTNDVPSITAKATSKPTTTTTITSSTKATKETTVTSTVSKKTNPSTKSSTNETSTNISTTKKSRTLEPPVNTKSADKSKSATKGVSKK